MTWLYEPCYKKNHSVCLSVCLSVCPAKNFCGRSFGQGMQFTLPRLGVWTIHVGYMCMGITFCSYDFWLEVMTLTLGILWMLLCPRYWCQCDQFVHVDYPLGVDVHGHVILVLWPLALVIWPWACLFLMVMDPPLVWPLLTSFQQFSSSNVKFTLCIISSSAETRWPHYFCALKNWFEWQFLSSSWSLAAVLDLGMIPCTEINTFNLPIMSFLSILSQNSNFCSR